MVAARSPLPDGEDSVMHLEPAVGGALTETVSLRGRDKVYELGRVTVWDPPRRLVIAWRPVNFRASDPSTEVEVTFERAIGPRGESTEGHRASGLERGAARSPGASWPRGPCVHSDDGPLVE